MQTQLPATLAFRVAALFNHALSEPGHRAPVAIHACRVLGR